MKIEVTEYIGTPEEFKEFFELEEIITKKDKENLIFETDYIKELDKIINEAFGI